MFKIFGKQIIYSLVLLSLTSNIYAKDISLDFLKPKNNDNINISGLEKIDTYNKKDINSNIPNNIASVNDLNKHQEPQKQVELEKPKETNYSITKNTSESTEENEYEVKIISDGKPKPDTTEVVKNGVKKTDIRKIRKEEKKLELALTEPLDKEPVSLSNEKKLYNQNDIVEITGKKGYSSILEFVDNLHLPLEISNIVVGESFFKATQFQNKITITPTIEYGDTNMFVYFKGKKFPVNLRINTQPKLTNFTNRMSIIYNEENQNTNYSSNIEKVKNELTKNALKTGDIDKYTKLNFDAFNISKGVKEFFTKDTLKIYKVDNLERNFYIVLLDNNYVINSFRSNSMEYANSYNVYIINNNDTSFTIVNKGSKESYKIILKSF